MPLYTLLLLPTRRASRACCLIRFLCVRMCEACRDTGIVRGLLSFLMTWYRGSRIRAYRLTTCRSPAEGLVNAEGCWLATWRDETPGGRREWSGHPVGVPTLSLWDVPFQAELLLVSLTDLVCVRRHVYTPDQDDGNWLGGSLPKDSKKRHLLSLYCVVSGTLHVDTHFPGARAPLTV